MFKVKHSIYLRLNNISIYVKNIRIFIYSWYFIPNNINWKNKNMIDGYKYTYLSPVKSLNELSMFKLSTYQAF